MHSAIRESLTIAQRTLDNFILDDQNIQRIADIALLIAECYRRRGKVIIFGNGGSMCDAMHFAEELTGRFRKDRPPLPAIAISDPAHITCVGNDYGFDEIFARGVQAYATAGDVIIGISTSGSSQNIIKALNSARNLDCTTVALLGKDGGKLAGTCDFEIIIPGETSDRIQEIHTLILHILIQEIEHELFYPADRPALFA
ncbi:MAG: SIS domain-containing protein [Candidatus Cloacimonetes bacterium]|jgi:D-sedoheptulose 7-phosphate isomerase|nr:SIS domain-containing protein [Candidatus Cloacimonadota bacterium]MDY0336407.1 SIS domain-containing protein [Candidatus Cloacimonadaceae bacterium]MCK9334827.1 SIS domain-containing protein [Candidatus Cloacimonadota bacterium]MDD2543800.1 SIS domain-containing protein [Candidatus Cloacimonadota bacterium]MDD2684112.1 SIS domain-containing protein [Candidatus Cloacimonadota bacterium]